MKKFYSLFLFLSFVFVSFGAYSAHSDGIKETSSVTNIQEDNNRSCTLFEDFENINPENPGYAGSIVTSPSG
ncbi:MAG: hypothetical protein LBU83_03390, partial [Bacteroidales bacterium]|nr:hypothetical protein [Bacteroidales bacterium]